MRTTCQGAEEAGKSQIPGSLGRSLFGRRERACDNSLASNEAATRGQSHKPHRACLGGIGLLHYERFHSTGTLAGKRSAKALNPLRQAQWGLHKSQRRRESIVDINSTWMASVRSQRGTMRYRPAFKRYAFFAIPRNSQNLGVSISRSQCTVITTSCHGPVVSALTRTRSPRP